MVPVMKKEVYRREKKTVAYQTGPDEVFIETSFLDWVHEMRVVITFQVSEQVITGARAEMARTPYDICTEVEQALPRLIGTRIEKGVISRVSGMIGGPAGCGHLADLVVEAIRSFVQARFQVRFVDLSAAEKFERLKEENKGFCFTYNNMDRNPKRLVKDNYQK
jgi:hypothetical protein